jgi:DNA repair exonuclease SbcCD ATPase subunit
VRISRLELRQFRRHGDLTLDLAPGLTVVRGPNESGKTTIQRAIELVLTRRVTSTSADVDGLRTWGAANGADGAPTIRIEFDQEDEEGRHSGSLEKTFRGAKGTVRLEVDGQPITDPTLADQRLAELTGIPTEAFFRSTASVRHHEVADLARDEAALRDRLQASISGGDRGTSRARKQLERAIHELTTKGAKNPGRLKVAETAVASTTTEVEQGERALEQLERDRVMLGEAIERRSEASTELETRRAMLEKARQAERLDAERAAANEKFERYRSAAAIVDDIGRLEGSHPSAVPLTNLRTSVEKLRTVDGRIRELKALLSDELEVTYEAPAPPRSWRWAMVAAVLAALGGLGITIAGLLVAGLQQAVAPGLVVVIVGLGAYLVARRLQIRSLAHRMGRELRDIDVDRRLRGRSMLQQELVDQELAEGQALRELYLPDLAAAEDLLGREQEHANQIERLGAQLLGLVGSMRPEAIIPERNAAALEVERKTHAIEELGPIAREPRARERLEVEVRQAETQLEVARDAEARARARLEANAVDAEDVAGRVERLASWPEQLAALQRRERVLSTTLAAIETAERSTMRRATRYLERTMVGDVERITGGRYRRVRVDDATLGIEVFAPERGDWVDVTALSQGTLDLIYLAARLGLVRLVTGDRRPPLVFDDPFVTLDDERAARAVELLRALATDFQVLYLTTSDRYDAAADAVRVLGGPAARDEATEGAAS